MPARLTWKTLSTQTNELHVESKNYLQRLQFFIYDGAAPPLFISVHIQWKYKNTDRSVQLGTICGR